MTGGEPETPQPNVGKVQVQDGECKDTEGLSQEEQLDYLHIPQGCLPFSTD